MPENGKRTVKILIPIWGMRYVARFFEFGLPSLLAPGNLPAMAETCDVEILFLTTERDRRRFESAPGDGENPGLTALRRSASMAVVNIDDLIVAPDLYGYTLTLAYLRGVCRYGDRAVDHHFVFFVGDYIYGDGSLRTLAKRINEGHRVILSSSLRAVAEDTLPIIAGPGFLQDDARVYPPRTLVKLALTYPHPSLAAKIVNHEATHSCNYQHLFWQVDESTLIGRSFMTHMLCLRPERAAPQSFGFCDYSFIPELCPTSEHVALTDSDDFIVLEIQNREHEAWATGIGKLDPSAAARSLAQWTTMQHRAFPKHVFVFHSESVPPSLRSFVAQSEELIRDISERLQRERPLPQPHAYHPHWTSGIGEFSKLADAQGKHIWRDTTTACPVPIADLNGALDIQERPRRSGLIGLVLRAIDACRRPDLPLNAAWAYTQLALTSASTFAEGARRVLLVSDFSDLARRIANRLPNASFLSLDEAKLGAKVGLAEGQEPFSAVALVTPLNDVPRALAIADRLRPLLVPDAQIFISARTYTPETLHIRDVHWLTTEREFRPSKVEVIADSRVQKYWTLGESLWGELSRRTLMPWRLIRWTLRMSRALLGSIRSNIRHALRRGIDQGDRISAFAATGRLAPPAPLPDISPQRAGGSWKPTFSLAMQVWGQRYVNAFLDVGLPSQLAAGNLGDFPWRDSSIYHIYTTHADARIIAENPGYQRLRELMDVRFVYIDEQIAAAAPGSKWSLVRYCHQQSVEEADDRDAAVFFLHPDQVWTKGSLGRAAAHIVSGASAVLCPGPRAIEELAAPALRSRHLSADGLSLAVPASALVRLGFVEFPHPETVNWFWDDENYFQYPTYIYFDVPEHGVIGFCYILHPVVVKPDVKHAPFLRVFDQDWLANACPDVRRIHISQSSDDVFHFELSPGGMSLPTPPSMPHLDPIQTMSWYAEGQYNRHHRQFVMHPVRMHYGDPNDKSWAEVEARGRMIVESVEAGLSLSDQDLMLLFPENLLRRIQTRNQFKAKDEVNEVERRMIARAQQAACERQHRRQWIHPPNPLLGPPPGLLRKLRAAVHDRILSKTNPSAEV